MEPNMRQSAEPQKNPAVQDGGVDAGSFVGFAEFNFDGCYSSAAPPVPAELDAIMAIAPLSEEELILLYPSGAPPVPAELDALMAIGPLSEEELSLLNPSAEPDDVDAAAGVGTSPFDTSVVPPPPPPPAAESDFDAVMGNDQWWEADLSYWCYSAAPPVPADSAALFDFYALTAIDPLSEEELSGWSAARPVAPGFRFHPTDEELVGYYLKRKVTGKSFKLPISVVDIYKFEPWDLPSKSKLNTRDLEWYFFTVLDKKYGRGSKAKRATEEGYWKTTGKDRAIRSFGMKKTLLYYKGRAPHGTLSNWVMHEYRIVDNQAVAQARPQQKEQPLVVCRIFKKRGTGPKNGEQYGAPSTNMVPDSTTLAPGFRFHPTDEELVGFYLKLKVTGKSLKLPIAVVDIYKFEPRDLPSKSKLKTRDLEWYFFTVLDKKYGSGSRTHRATQEGYWKATGKDRAIKHAERSVGMKKTLVYHKGRTPHGTRSNWVMHEYRIVNDQAVAQARPQQLHSAPESSNAAHVTACMVSITNITVRGNAMDWMMGKNGGFNTIIATGFSHPVVASAMLPVSGLLTSKTAFVLLHSWIFLILFSVPILSISFKIGSYMYAGKLRFWGLSMRQWAAVVFW